MPRPLNPFDPSHPIDPTKFVGRQKEIRELEAALVHAKMNRPRHFLITGERGVGKTSFFDYIRRRATELSDGGGFNFAVVDFSVHKQTTKLDFARALKSQLDSLLDGNPTHKETIGRLWSFIQRFEVAGVSYRGEERPENDKDMYQDVADSLCEIVRRVCAESDESPVSAACDGVLILVDEVDQASAELDIGTFFKYLLEKLNRRGCHKVVVGLAGLTQSTDVLLASHPSSLRVFDELALGNLSRSEVKDLLDEVQTLVCDEGFGEFRISDNARELLYDLSAGHPHMLHQLGYCAFEMACGASADEFCIDQNHVMTGFIEARGALDMIGDMYFRRAFEEIEPDHVALAVLDHMSERGQGELITDLAKETLASEKDVRRAVESMTRKGLLTSLGMGRYAIRHPTFAYWIKSRRPQAA